LKEERNRYHPKKIQTVKTKEEFEDLEENLDDLISLDEI